MQKLLVATVLSISLAGCGITPEQWHAISQNLATAAGSSSPLPAPSKLMVFGGHDHQTYLGCLSCSEYASDSIANEYGSFGSPYSSTSVTNSYSAFGSQYSSYSACNPYATDPPVIVDSQGHFYGRLTVNMYNAQRSRDENLMGWLAAICEH